MLKTFSVTDRPGNCKIPFGKRENPDMDKLDNSRGERKKKSENVNEKRFDFVLRDIGPTGPIYWPIIVQFRPIKAQIESNFFALVISSLTFILTENQIKP